MMVCSMANSVEASLSRAPLVAVVKVPRTTISALEKSSTKVGPVCCWQNGQVGAAAGASATTASVRIAVDRVFMKISRMEERLLELLPNGRGRTR